MAARDPAVMRTRVAARVSGWGGFGRDSKTGGDGAAEETAKMVE